MSTKKTVSKPKTTDLAPAFQLVCRVCRKKTLRYTSKDDLTCGSCGSTYPAQMHAKKKGKGSK